MYPIKLLLHVYLLAYIRLRLTEWW